MPVINLYIIINQLGFIFRALLLNVLECKMMRLFIIKNFI